MVVNYEEDNDEMDVADCFDLDYTNKYQLGLNVVLFMIYLGFFAKSVRKLKKFKRGGNSVFTLMIIMTSTQICIITINAVEMYFYRIEGSHTLFHDIILDTITYLLDQCLLFFLFIFLFKMKQVEIQLEIWQLTVKKLMKKLN